MTPKKQQLRGSSAERQQQFGKKRGRSPIVRVGSQLQLCMPVLDLDNLPEIQKVQQQEELKLRRDMQDAQNDKIKGISKQFVKYKQSLKNPTDEELKFHDFVHTAVKRRQEKRTEMLKKRKEEALLAEKQKKIAKE